MNPELPLTLQKSFEENHFAGVNKTIARPKGASKEIDDFMLTRYACYLIAQNGDPRKEQMTLAQLEKCRPEDNKNKKA